MKLNGLLIVLSGATLLTAALSRFLIAAGNSANFSLSFADPALGIPLLYSVLGVGALELLVALICLLGKNPLHQFAWLAWLSTDYLAFRICLIFIGVHPQNTCIGTLTDPLHLSRGPTGLIISLVPVFLVLYSYSALIYLWRHSSTYPQIHQSIYPSSTYPPIQQSTNPAFLRASCPSCSGHIEFPSHGLGQTISCPHCHIPMTLRI